MTVHREQSMKREKPTRCNNKMFIIKFCLNVFRASLCPSSGEQRLCYCIWCILVWFCWMWLVAVVGRCLVGCEQTEVNNKNVIVASCWFYSLHTLLRVLIFTLLFLLNVICYLLLSEKWNLLLKFLCSLK